MPAVRPGVILDADGTLLDSLSVWDEAPVRFLRAAGRNPDSDLPRRLAGMSFDRGADYLREHYALPQSREEIKAAVSREAERAFRDEIPAKPGALAFLRRLRELRIPAVVATEGDAALLRAAFRRLGMESSIREILACDAFGTSKREPTIFLEAARRLGAKPDKIMVAEDAPHAVRTAAKAGFVVAAFGGEGARAAVSPFAAGVFRDFEDPAFLRFFESWYSEVSQ